MVPQPFLHHLETQQREVISAVGAERQRDDLRAPPERGGDLLDQVSLEDRAEISERPVYPHMGRGRHGPRDAGRKRPVSRVGKDARRIAADRVLLLAVHPGQPRVLVGRARQQAAVGNYHEHALAVGCVRGHARVGERDARDLLRFGGRAGAEGADVENVVRCRYPLAEGPVDVGAGLLHAPPLVRGEFHPGQAAHVVVVRDRGAGHDPGHAIDVSVTDQQGALPVQVIDFVTPSPVGPVGCRAFQAVHDIRNAGQNQPDLRVETALRLALFLVMARHPDPYFLCLVWGTV